jgi:hypothetical protein
VRGADGTAEERGKQHMTKSINAKQTNTPDDLIRERIIERAKKYNAEILKRFSIAAEDLERGSHHGALGALDGIDSTLQEYRVLLRLAE